MKDIRIGRPVGPKHKPLVIADIGINHEGTFEKARRMVIDAHNSGAECVKFQCHIPYDEMVKNNVIPSNADESIWNMMKRCALTEDEEIKLKRFVEKLGMTYLCTPFSRAAADRLEKMGVKAYKIGSGECNNYPLVEHIASFGKPIILSTGMNNIHSISKSVEILKRKKVQYALLHCTSMYPTPYKYVRLGAITELKEKFPDTVIGLSDHSIGNYACFGAVALGASILEKHFTSNKSWPGPDIPISLDPQELKELIIGSRFIHMASGGSKTILKEEEGTIKFAYACVVSTKKIKKGEKFSNGNIWVKRPGTGEILAEEYNKLLGKKAKKDINKDTQIRRNQIER